MDMPKVHQEPEISREELIDNLKDRILALKEGGITEITGSNEIAQKVIDGIADPNDTDVSDDDLRKLDWALLALESNTARDAEPHREE